MLKNDNEVNNFLRLLTAAEKKEYRNIKGTGAQTRKKEFREMIQAQRLKNATAKQNNVAILVVI